MSLHREPIGEIPAETARVARAAFPKGTVVTRLRDEFTVLFDEFSALFKDEDFRAFYPARGQPGLAVALGAGHGVSVPGAPERPAGCRCRGRPH